MQLLLDNVPKEHLEAFLARGNNNQSTALSVAASHGNTVIVEALLQCPCMSMNVLLMPTSE